MEKYRVTLTAEERDALEKLVSVGRSAARKLTHARMLLLADTAHSEGRMGMTRSSWPWALASGV